jgi:hypothetical protein
MNNKSKLTLLIGILVVIGVSVCSTSVSTASAQSSYTIKVAKTTDGDFTVTNGASYVGENFVTIYSMTGTSPDFIKAKEALTSAIVDDFGKSPTIGYIKMNKVDTQANQTNANTTGLANPFVSKEQIDEKVKSVLAYAIDKIEHPVGITLNIGDSREVRCEFSNILSDFWCDIPTFLLK